MDSHQTVIISLCFTGASDFGAAYQPQITSYDYDAPLDEAGDPTVKFYAIRNLLAKVNTIG